MLTPTFIVHDADSLAVTCCGPGRAEPDSVNVKFYVSIQEYYSYYSVHVTVVLTHPSESSQLQSESDCYQERITTNIKLLTQNGRALGDNQREAALSEE